MAAVYVKSSGTRTSTVTVDTVPGRVVVATRDGCRAPRLDCCPADAPGDLARRIGEGLIRDGYALAS
jgi:hypothetical protein